MTIITMNVNGISSAWDRGLKYYIREAKPDIFCLQEIRTSKNLELYFIPGYSEWFFPNAEKSGYAGVGAFSRRSPKQIIQGLGVPNRDGEGRAITLEMKDFYLVNVYAPTSGNEMEGLSAKIEWLEDLRRFVSFLENSKPVIICGDLNVAAGGRDFPEQATRETAGNSLLERDAFNSLLNDGYYDVWRMAHPGTRGISWTPNWAKKNSLNYGWRLDYFLVSTKLMQRVSNCEILGRTDLSDHQAVALSLK